MTTPTLSRPAPPKPSGNGPSASLPDDAGGGGPRWVELLRARNDIEAHLLTGRLAEAAIETRTVKDRSAPGASLYGGSNPWAPVVILVKSVQLDDARLVLAEISWAQPPKDPSLGQAEPLHRSHALAWWAIALALGIAFTSVALARAADSGFSCDLPIVCGSSEGTP